MITILGAHDTAEYEAALHMRDMIADAWPHSIERADAAITLIAGVKCYGQAKAQDIDLVVLINLPHPYGIGTFKGQPLFVRSLCLTIEVKDNPPEYVEFEGNQVYVKYRNQDNWHNASEQSFQQMHAVRNYLQAQGIAHTPFVVNLIWVRQVPESALPTMTHNIIGSDATWETLVQRVATRQNPWRTADGDELRAVQPGPDDSMQQAVDILSYRMQPTPLDRRKIEAITRRVLTNQSYVEALLERRLLLIFRGRGGTGKTVRLLQLAHQLYQEQEARVLLLTYNVALVSDIKRLLMLMGISHGMARRRIMIQTVHSFVWQVLHGLSIIGDDTPDFLARYDEHKAMLLAMLREGAVRDDDLHIMMQADAEHFSYDYIMVDEAQDWPPDERDVLFALYDYRQCVLAHGYDQLIRRASETNWRATIPQGTSQIVTLKQSLRLKAGLCHVVNAIAEALGLTDWSVQPDPQVYGGQVLVVVGSYSQSLHAYLLERHTEHGNAPVDMLFCVPPDLVDQDNRACRIAPEIRAWGYQVWDGTHQATRHLYPTSTDDHRMVQYDSCRGLEGWTAVHLGFDALYDYKYNEYMPTDDEAAEMFFDEAQAAHAYAIRWLMIPLTRAIDTLVVQIASADHVVGMALRTVAHRYPELVNWLRLDG